MNRFSDGSSTLPTSTIKGLQKRYSHRKTLILSGFFLFFIGEILVVVLNAQKRYFLKYRFEPSQKTDKFYQSIFTLN